jgi:hypothetical protein
MALIKISIVATNVNYYNVYLVSDITDNQALSSLQQLLLLILISAISTLHNLQGTVQCFASWLSMCKGINIVVISNNANFFISAISTLHLDNFGPGEKL